MLGMDGTVAILRSYKHLLDESVGRFPFPKLILSARDSRWQDRSSKIREFLGFQSA
jgi:hypothetical protein